MLIALLGSFARWYLLVADLIGSMVLIALLGSFDRWHLLVAVMGRFDRRCWSVAKKPERQKEEGNKPLTS